MYITNTTDNVIKIMNNLETANEIDKMEFLLYVFNCINNNQINSKNECNPNIGDNDDLTIFNLGSIGMSPNACAIFLQFNVLVYNSMDENNNVMINDGYLNGLDLNEVSKKIISNFEKISFKEKLDVISELIIKYDNKTYFGDKVEIVNFSSNRSGYDIAKKIIDFKNRFVEN